MRSRRMRSCAALACATFVFATMQQAIAQVAFDCVAPAPPAAGQTIVLGNGTPGSVSTVQLQQALDAGGLACRPQPEDGVTYAEKITPADRELDLGDPRDAWLRIRALAPHIGAWTTLHGRRVTIWRARLEGGELVPEEVQPEGKRRMAYDEFLRGVQA